MQSNQSRLMLAMLFGVLALSAVTAVAAQAVEAPRWSIKGTVLGAGETHFVTAKAYSASLTLNSGTENIACTALKLKEGSLLGSSAGNAGKDNEVIEFTGCTVTGPGITKCKVNEPIVTVPVLKELVETEKAEPAKEKGSLLTLFKPASGATFTTLKFTRESEGKCPPETKVTGSVAAQVLTDPENGTLGELVELGKAKKEAKSWLLNFSDTPISKVTRIIGGEVSEIAVKLECLSEPAALEGTALILLAKRNTKGELESETTLWSPLP